MRLKYETGIITLIQFIVMSLLSLANSLNSVITTCVKESGQCIENMIPSIILFILIAAWFAFIWILGYAVQERRGRKLSAALISAEGIIALIALFSIRHHTDWLSFGTSVVDLVLSVWVMLLAFRIFLAGDSRVVSRGGVGRKRARARRRPPTASL
ncbi:MAG TPA: hypothetical protein VFH99_03820 [Candidatus Saccharimonadales bacterium]|nr:hypothetical protein [Candidatus Saccharimonadales bacterium]